MVLTASVWHCRPSDFISNFGGVEAYALDVAGAYRLKQIEDEQTKTGSKSKKQYSDTANEWL